MQEQAPEFVLEKYLEDIGQQYPTEIGTIDILARDTSDHSYVVIELKKGRESDRVL